VGSNTSTRFGYTAGLGFEWMLNQQWTFKTEALYYDLGTSSYALSTAFILSPVAGAFTSANATFSNRIDGIIYRAGVNYHFAAR
jgi:outer membrane immunogenic protein